jgi:hypothetical protein
MLVRTAVTAFTLAQLFGPTTPGLSALYNGAQGHVSYGNGSAASCGNLAECWGSTATCTVNTGYDAIGTLTIASSGTGITACGVNTRLFSVTYNNAFAAAPVVMLSVSNASSGLSTALPTPWAFSAAGSFNMATATAFTPITADSISFQWISIGVGPSGG